MVALRSQGNWRWEGPLGTPLALVHWKRASSPVEESHREQKILETKNMVGGNVKFSGELEDKGE